MDNEILLLNPRVRQIAQAISETDLLDDLRLIQRLVEQQTAAVESHLRRMADTLRTKNSWEA